MGPDRSFRQIIWKPNMLPEMPLTITTSLNSPYDDSFKTDGLLRYRYRGTDPSHPDNRGLRHDGTVSPRDRVCCLPERALDICPNPCGIMGLPTKTSQRSWDGNGDEPRRSGAAVDERRAPGRCPQRDSCARRA